MNNGDGETWDHLFSVQRRRNNEPFGMPWLTETSNTWRVTNSFIVQLLIVSSDLQEESETSNLEKGDGGGREAWWHSPLGKGGGHEQTRQ